MELKPAVKEVVRPAGRLFATMVTRVVGPRLAALENAHGNTWAEVRTLKGFHPEAVEARLIALETRLAALEQATRDARSDLQKLGNEVPAVLDAVSRQHGITRAAVRAERQLSQQADGHARRLTEIERRLSAAPPEDAVSAG